jgi:quinoprotein glucose dehydrogenase
MFPGSLGGVNWGGASFDPSSGLLYANTNRYAFRVALVPRPNRTGEKLKSFVDRHTRAIIALGTLVAVLIALLSSMISRRSLLPGWVAVTISLAMILIAAGAWHFLLATGPPTPPRLGEHFGHEVSPQTGTPYSLDREPIVTPSGSPCTVQPWGTVSAVNLNTGKAAWQTPLGTLIAGQHTGTVNLGGNIVTASGLVFTAASVQPLLRAFNATTGEELWAGAIPAPAQSTPMSYTIDGRQFVVIAAGGHGTFGTPISDALVAFALPKH